MSKKLINPIVSISYSSAGKVDTVEIPKSFPLYGIDLWFDLQYDISSELTLIDEGLTAMIDKIELVGDGTTLQTWTGKMLAAFNAISMGRPAPYKALSTAVANNNTASLALHLPFQVYNVPNFGVCFLDPQKFSTLHLKITWAAVTGIYSAGTGTLDSATIYISANRLMSSPAELAPKRGGIFRDLIVSEQLKNFSASTSTGTIDLPRDNDIVGLLVRASDSSTGKTLSNTAINNIKVVEGGNNVTHDLTWNMAQYRMLQEQPHAWDLMPYVGTPTTQYRMEGYAYINFCFLGLQDAIKPQNLSNLQLVMDVDASSRVEVSTISLRAA